MNTPVVRVYRGIYTGKPPETGRIQDFGKHIPGARKELAAARLSSAVANDPGFERSLSEVWPAPRWTELAEEHRRQGRPPEDLAWIRTLRDGAAPTGGPATGTPDRKERNR